MKIGNSKNGFIALTSVIIITAILILVATTISFSGFFARFNILDSELKTQSGNLAGACISEGLLVAAHNLSHIATTTIIVGKNYLGQCDLGPIPTSGNPRFFFTQASSSEHFTTLKTTYDPTTFSIISEEELQ